MLEQARPLMFVRHALVQETMIKTKVAEHAEGLGIGLLIVLRAMALGKRRYNRAGTRAIFSFRVCLPLFFLFCLWRVGTRGQGNKGRQISDNVGTGTMGLTLIFISYKILSIVLIGS